MSLVRAGVREVAGRDVVGMTLREGEGRRLALVGAVDDAASNTEFTAEQVAEAIRRVAPGQLEHLMSVLEQDLAELRTHLDARARLAGTPPTVLAEAMILLSQGLHAEALS